MFCCVISWYVALLWIIDASDFLLLTNKQFIIPSSSLLNQDVCFDLTINGDVIREPDETFTVTVVVGNSNDVIVGSNTVTVTILDDSDGMKTYSFCIHNNHCFLNNLCSYCWLYVPRKSSKWWCPVHQYPSRFHGHIFMYHWLYDCWTKLSYLSLLWSVVRQWSYLWM